MYIQFTCDNAAMDNNEHGIFGNIYALLALNLMDRQQILFTANGQWENKQVSNIFVSIFRFMTILSLKKYFNVDASI